MDRWDGPFGDGAAFYTSLPDGAKGGESRNGRA